MEAVLCAASADEMVEVVEESADGTEVIVSHQAMGVASDGAGGLAWSQAG